jgi:hypothetical protein
MVRLVDEHWELARQNIPMFVAPKEMKNAALGRISKGPSKQLA